MPKPGQNNRTAPRPRHRLPCCSTMSAVSSKDLDRELRSIFAAPGFDADAETVKSIKKRVVERLGVGTFPKSLKSEFKDLLQRLLDEHSDSGREEEDAPVRKVKAKRKRSSEATAPAKTTYGANVHRLLDLGQAMRMGPRLHRGLKDMENPERIAVLTARLREAGATWKGKVPSPSDISKAKAERQKQDDLDGIDTSCIIEGGRSRRRGRACVNYAVDDDNDDEEVEEMDTNESSRSRKKSREQEKKKHVVESDSSDAEAEF